MTHSVCMRHIIEQTAQCQSITNRYLPQINQIIQNFFTHFQFKSVLSSNTQSWLTYNYSWGVAEVLPVFATILILFNSSQLFFSLFHDKHFETNEKNSNRIDELITLFHNTIHRQEWWVGCIHFIFSTLLSRGNCIIDLRAFCSFI